MNKIGAGGKNIFLVTVIIQLVIIFACIVLSFIYSCQFLIAALALTPSILLVLNLAFVSIKDGQFLIERLFRRSVKIPFSEFEQVSISFFSIPFSNTIKISFKNGIKYSFLGGGYGLGQIKTQIHSAIKIASK